MGNYSLLQLLSAGRSGSTIISKLLATLDGVVACGELQSIWQLGIIDNRPCSCGMAFSDCEFWSEVISRSGLGKQEAKKAVALNRAVGRVRYAYPRYVIASRFRHVIPNTWQSILEANERLLDGIAAVSGAQIIIDTSPNPLRVVMLAKRFPVIVVHLVRDPRAVVHSWMNPKYDPVFEAPMQSRGVISAAFQWVLQNFLIEHAVRETGGMRVTYEQFAENPRLFFHNLVQALPSLKDSVSVLGDDAIVGPDHIILGNPIRSQTGRVKIRPDLRFVKELDRTDEVLIKVLTKPSRNRYGYADY